MQSQCQNLTRLPRVARTKILVALPKSSKVSPFITQENGSWRNTCSKTLRAKE
jgi:hypothetical protein